MKGHRFQSSVGIVAAAVMAVSGCMAMPTGAVGAAAPVRPSTDRQMAAPTATSSTRRGLPETAAAVAAWLSFEASSRTFEREQVPTADKAAPLPVATPAPADPGAAAALPLAAPAPNAPAAGEAPLVAPEVGGVENADGTVTLTVNREGTRSEGPYSETLTLTYQKATRRPVTYRHRLSVTRDGRALVSQSRSKVWQPDGRFTESVSLSGYDQAATATQAPWRMDATTQSAADGQETTIGTLRRADGSTLTVRRTRSGRQTTLEITDSRQNLKLSGSSDTSADVRALTVLIDGQPNGTLDLPASS
jgi:hypothetical protein